MRGRSLIGLIAGAALAGCTTPTPRPSADFPTGTWNLGSPAAEAYLLAPGDSLALTVYSAPELSRTVTIGPDGRVRLPLIAPVVAAGKTPEILAADVRAAYAEQLRSPQIDLLVDSYGSQQIFVGGEVTAPGQFPLPGPIDPLQAIILAGGPTVEARENQAFLMRRLADGSLKTAIIDISAGLENPELAAWGPVQRFDVIYVPRSRIANQNRFIQQYIRQALPIEFSLFYDIAGNDR